MLVVVSLPFFGIRSVVLGIIGGVCARGELVITRVGIV